MRYPETIVPSSSKAAGFYVGQGGAESRALGDRLTIGAARRCPSVQCETAGTICRRSFMMGRSAAAFRPIMSER